MKMPSFESLFNTKKRDKASVGLNLGVSSVKLAKLRMLENSVELAAFSVEQNQLDLEGTLKKLRDAYSIHKVNISVSGQQAITRYVDFPKMNRQELRQSLKFEAQKFIPFPSNEVNMDAVILRDDLPDNKMRVLLAAVKKDHLAQRLKILNDLGFEIGVVDIDSLALINSFNYNYSDDPALKDKIAALLNIGSATSNLSILENGTPSLSRDIGVGGNHFTQKIADVVGLDFKAAEQVKTGERETGSKVAVAVESVLARLAQEVRSSFDYFESRSVKSVEKIFISGGASMYNGLGEMLSDLLALPVSNWDSFRKISFAEGVDANLARSVASQLPVAIGLALRN